MSYGASEKKPFCGDLVRVHFKNKTGRLVDPSRIVIVGDRLMTDVCLGHILGGLSILVLPWDLKNEQKGIKIGRTIENFIWSNIFKNKLVVHDNEQIRLLADRLTKYIIVPRFVFHLPESD